MSLFRAGCLVKTRNPYSGVLCWVDKPYQEHFEHWTSVVMTAEMIGLYLRKETIKTITYDFLLLEEKIVYLKHGQLILAKTLRENEKPQRKPK